MLENSRGASYVCSYFEGDLWFQFDQCVQQSRLIVTANALKPSFPYSAIWAAKKFDYGNMAVPC